MKFATVNDMYLHYCRDLPGCDGSSPRGMKTHEKLYEKFEIANPSCGWTTLKSRKLNYRFAIMEAVLNVWGNNDVETLCYYNKNLRNFADCATGTFTGAYGPRILRGLNSVIEELRRDPDSRRAVISIYDSGDLYDGNKDVPCTMSLHFMIRDNKLDIAVHMRSNDLLWGTGYDTGQFVFLQKIIAHCLKMPIGKYVHFADSLHVYESTVDQINKIGKSEVVNAFIYPEFDTSLIDLKHITATISEFLDMERSFREKGLVRENTLPEPFKYFYDVITRTINL